MTQPATEPDEVLAPLFARDGGEAGALVRSLDWSRTPLGPMTSWPSSLRTTVGTLLSSRHPMFLWWGPELIQFYNDAYIPSFGIGKHPAAMGQRGADCWQEIWPIIWPQIDDVMSRGIASWNVDHLVPIIRNGRIEEVYWTYSYSPVFDDDGSIGGTLVVCSETTSRVLTERRLRSMRELAVETTLAADPQVVIASALEAFSKATGDIMFALLYSPSTANAPPVVEGTSNLPDDVAHALDLHLRDIVEACAREGETHPLPRHIAIAGSPWPEPVSDVFVVPVGFRGQVPSGYVLFGLSPRLPFDHAYRAHLCEIGEHIAQARARIDALHVRAVAESERNSLLEHAPVATALLTGPDHVFRLANPSFLRIVGRTDLIGKPYLQAFPELSESPLPRILDKVYQTGAPFVTDEMRVRLDRSGSGVLEDCYFQFNLEPLRSASGHVYGMMAVALDITPQVLARKNLERGQLERDALVIELERASRAKDEFLAMLGHELRNPLSPILTALQLMRLRGVTGADKEREIIERQVNHVVGLVDDLLDVSRITRGKITLKQERVLVTDIVAGAIEQASPLIDHRRHRLRVDVVDDLAVDGDRGRLAQVVANLLTNAAKYTEPGGRIEVEAKEHEGEVWLRVRDTGIGVSPEMLPHVFDTFAQERQQSDRQQGGLGLGLAIVKSLVAAHRGTVVLQSEGRGRGTECVVRLPVAAGERSAPTTTGALPVATSTPGYRILLVDDNEDAAEMLADSLRSLGHEVQVAFDAHAALERAESFVPDVALLDLGLPVIDGFELAGRLREQEGWAGVRLAALTGYGQPSDRLRTMTAGFDAHLVKPIDVGKLDALLRGFAAPDASPGQHQ